jgi:hypothetical protein
MAIAIVGLGSILAIAFLIACLRGFSAALGQKHIAWAVLLIREENNVVEFPRCKSPSSSFPKAA